MQLYTMTANAKIVDGNGAIIKVIREGHTMFVRAGDALLTGDVVVLSSDSKVVLNAPETGRSEPTMVLLEHGAENFSDYSSLENAISNFLNDSNGEAGSLTAALSLLSTIPHLTNFDHEDTYTEFSKSVLTEAQQNILNTLTSSLYASTASDINHLASSQSETIYSHNFQNSLSEHAEVQMDHNIAELDTSPTYITAFINLNIILDERGTSAPINTPPSGADGTVTLNENSFYIFSGPNFNCKDPDGDPLVALKIISLPTAGTLEYDATGTGHWVSVTDDQVIPWSSLPAGHLRFEPAANESGTNYSNFGFEVSDGKDYSRPNVMTINVTEVDTQIGGNGADQFTLGPAIDIVSAGGGDDIISTTVANLSNADTVDGGTDSGIFGLGDVLRLVGSGQNLDLTTLNSNVLQNIEVIDLTGQGNNSVTFNSVNVNALLSNDASPHGIFVEGNAGDSAIISTAVGGHWTQGADQIVNGNTYHVYVNDATNTIQAYINDNVLVTIN